MACSVDTYAVPVDSTEVSAGSLELQLDASHAEGDEDVLRVVVNLDGQRSDACPVLADDVRIVLETDSGQTDLDVQERGGGSYGVDCAFKCSQLVKVGTDCNPVRAELRGNAVRALRSSATMRVFLADTSKELGASMERSAFEPRSARLEVATTGVGPANASLYTFAEVAYEWSHDDVGHWVNEWADNMGGERDGEFSEFNMRDAEPLDPDQPRRRVFNVRNTADRGVRTVYFGATAKVATCELATCAGLEHVTAATLLVHDE